MAARFSTIDDYIASFPEDVQLILSKVRRSLRKVLPTADEKIKQAHSVRPHRARRRPPREAERDLTLGPAVARDRHGRD